MPWDVVGEDPDGITAGVRHLLGVRRSLPHLHAATPTEIWDPRDPGVLLLVRRHPSGPLLSAHNVSAEDAWVDADVLHWLGLHTPGLREAITGAAPRLEDGSVRLAPYSTAWLYDAEA